MFYHTGKVNTRPIISEEVLVNPFGGLKEENGEFSINNIGNFQIDDNGNFIHTTDPQYQYFFFRVLINGRLNVGNILSVGQQERTSRRSFVMPRDGRLTRFIILGTQPSSTVPARVDISPQLLINGSFQPTKYRNSRDEYVTILDVGINLQQGDVIGIFYTPRRNRKGFTFVLEYLED